MYDIVVFFCWFFCLLFVRTNAIPTTIDNQTEAENSVTPSNGKPSKIYEEY